MRVKLENHAAVRLPFLPLAGESWIGGNGRGKFHNPVWQPAMTVSFLLLFLLCLPLAHAEETEAPLDLIELLGEMEEEGAELEIALSELQGKANVEGIVTTEVKDEE